MKLHTVLPALIALIALASGAPRSRAANTIPAELDGTMMPYHFFRGDSVAEYPDSLRPFHIEYVGRHGARYLSSAKKTKNLITVLSNGEKDKILTAEGRRFLALLREVERVSEGKWGRLSALGEEEQERLGALMARRWPTIFQGQGQTGEVAAVASYVPRVVKSMYSFLEALEESNPRLETSAESGRRFSPLMRFFDVDIDYRDWLNPVKLDDDGSGWNEPLTTFEADHLPTAPASRLFKVGRAPGEGPAMQKLSMQMYGVLQGLSAFGMERRGREFMSQAEYRACWECDNLDHYLKRSLSALSTLPVQAAIPLLIDIVQKADEAESGLKTPLANLRFGHAETVIPLAALMKLPGAEALPDDYTKLADEWKDWEVSPLAAYIELCLACTQAGETYARVSLNGRPMQIEDAIWIPWKRLRAYWLHRASSF